MAIIAAVALLPLQYILLARVYNSLEKNLYVTVDECFRNAVEEESMMRFYSLSDSTASFFPSSNVLIDIGETLEKKGSSVNLDTLRSIFAANLSAKELQTLSFKIVQTVNDTNVFRTADDFLTDPDKEKSTFSSLSTHIDENGKVNSTIAGMPKRLGKYVNLNNFISGFSIKADDPRYEDSAFFYYDHRRGLQGQSGHQL